MKAWLAWLNPRTWLKVFIKNILIRKIQNEGDLLQGNLKLALDEKGPAALDDVIDASQRRLIMAINTAGPTWAWLAPFRNNVNDLIQEFGDQIQANLKKQVAALGPAAIDAAMDQAQELLIQKIKDL